MTSLIVWEINWELIPFNFARYGEEFVHLVVEDAALGCSQELNLSEMGG